MSWSGVGARVGTVLGESHPVATIPSLALDAEAVGCAAKRVCLKQGKIGSGTFATVFAYVSAFESDNTRCKPMRAKRMLCARSTPPLHYGRGRAVAKGLQLVGSAWPILVLTQAGCGSSGLVAVKRSREGTSTGGIESPAVKELAFLAELQASQAVVSLAPGVDVAKAAADTHRSAVGAAGRALDSGAFIHKHQLYLVMEPYACDVSAWVGSAGGLAPEERFAAGLAVAQGTLKAMARVHERGWCHRDIKPANVLLRAVPVSKAAALPPGQPADAEGSEGAAGTAGGAAYGAARPCDGVVLADAGLACRVAPGPCSGLRALASARALPATEDTAAALWTGGCGGPTSWILPQQAAAGQDSQAGSEHSSPMPWEAECWAPTLGPDGLAEPSAPPPRRVCAQAGTLWYRAPELLFGAPRHGPAADVWAAACLVWEALTGVGADAEPLLRSDSEMAQIRVISDLLGPAGPDVWPGISIAAPYMAGSVSPGGQDPTAPRAASPTAIHPDGDLWGTRPSLPDAVEASRARVEARLLQRLRASPALGGTAAGCGPASSGNAPSLDELSGVASLLSHMLLYDPDLRPAAVQCLAHPALAKAPALGRVMLPGLKVEPRRQPQRQTTAEPVPPGAAPPRPPFAARFALHGASPGGFAPAALAFRSPGAAPRASGFPLGSDAASSPRGRGGSSAVRHASGGRLLFADPPSTGASSAASQSALPRPLRMPAAFPPFSPPMRPSALAFDDTSPGSQASPGLGAACNGANARPASARKRPRDD